ncbi:hypothetical protein A4G19_15895 [Pasteurellaceae bacterium Macca]|nr:hypothetical protein [Pasteurellaceae bacterium Macca]MCK3656157.1 hypothetical protein [Pasteurellaceae bacterium Macca]MCK3656249.1 hypothetical protein [Pasteurellaceae bacterium Macca]MCK3656515.1 hypothetical protein [Pasteurellaceae bacterium Macca]MCK3657138.1 hypothetical protein [Pasteurellaceae bacterium Macca]
MFNQTQLSNRTIGTIILDATTSEDHTSELAISENPIESGAMIADHAVLKPKSITISGVVVDHDHGKSPLEQLGVPHIRGVTDFLDKVPLPFKVVTQTQQAIARANRLLNQGSYLLKQAVNGYEQARSLAPFLPDFGLGGQDNSASLGRVQKCYADLVACQKSGQTIEIQTGIHLYKNMLIESVSVRQGMEGSAEFTISAKEVVIVETQTTASRNTGRSSSNKKGKSRGPMGKKKSGRAANQSAPKTQRGHTQTKPVSENKRSVLAKIFH